MVVRLPLPIQSVPITTKIVNLNPVHGQVIQIHIDIHKTCIIKNIFII
jgi:hypothetical protein